MFSRTRPTPCSAASRSRIGSIALHGSHHGAQKSTIVGLPARSTSSLEGRVGDLSHRLPPSAASRSSGTFQIASSTIARDIFEPPTSRSTKRIGTSTTRKPRAQRAVGRLDLERVAARVDRVEVDRLEHLAAEALEAAGQVADGHAEQQPRVERAAGARSRAARRPSSRRRRPARSASRARGRRPRPRRAGAARRPGRARSRSPSRGRARRRLERAPEAGEVGGAEALLARPVEDVDPARARPRAGRRARRCRPASRRRSRARGRPGRAPRRARAPSARGSRARCRSAGRRRRAHLRIIAADGRDAAEERRGRRPARAARRPARARGRGLLPRARLPPRGDADPRDRRLGRAARARRQGEGAVRDRQDDRGEDRPDRREGRDRGAHEAEGARARGGRQVHAPARARPEDGAPDLAGARRHDARRAEGGGRAAAAARARRASARRARRRS